MNFTAAYTVLICLASFEMIRSIAFVFPFQAIRNFGQGSRRIAHCSSSKAVLLPSSIREMSGTSQPRRTTRSAARAAASSAQQSSTQSDVGDSTQKRRLSDDAKTSNTKRATRRKKVTRKVDRESEVGDTVTASKDDTNSLEQEAAPKKAPRVKKSKAKAAAVVDPDEIIETSCDVAWGPCSNELLKLSTWNINGCRAVLKSGMLLAYLEREQPDLLLLQETRLTSDTVKEVPEIDGYDMHWNHCTAKKGYSGVAVFVAKEMLERKGLSVQSVTPGMGDEETDSEGRILTTVLSNDIAIVNAYVPNAGNKLVRLSFRTETFEPKMRQFLDGLRKKHKRVVYSGDLNVAHNEIDIHNSKGNQKSSGHTPQERSEFGELLNSGWVDVLRHMYPKKRAYTYFSLRFGDRMQRENKGTDQSRKLTR